ncbi:MAG: YHS domain-containing protein [Desulfobaccales bacterium]
MKKMIMVFLGLILASFMAGTGLAADAPASGQAQAACPVMGGKPDTKLYADYHGQRVYFCCPACLELFKKDPDKYIQKLKEQQTAPQPGTTGKEQVN